MKRLNFIVLLLLLNIPSFSVTLTAVTGDWDNSTNTVWGGATPVSGDLLIIPNGVTVTIPVGIGVDLTGPETTIIRIEDGGTLTLELLSSLNLDDNDGDKIILVSNNSTLNVTFPSAIIFGDFWDLNWYTEPTTTGPAVLENGVLPIELLYFRAEQEGSVVQLEWATSLEENFDYFTLQRSIDGMNFEKIAEIHGAGNTTEKQIYNYTDRNPLPGNLYYRLKATDFDGTFEFFDIITLRFTGKESRTVALYPNPATDGRVTLRLNYRPTSPVSVVIYDQMGRQYMTKMMEGTSETFVLPSGMRKGMYLVRITDDQNKLMAKFSVQ